MFFAILIFAFESLIIAVFPNIGWHFLTALYILIGLAQILYYFLTTYLNISMTVISFIANFILWVAEQVNLEKIFSESFFYKELGFAVVLLGGVLWGINKIILDYIFFRMKVKFHLYNRIEKLLT